MPYRIIRQDITQMETDAIVNSANPEPVIGSGVDTGIHEAAGPELLSARKLIGKMKPGQCAVTSGFNLKAKYVIHTVGPCYIDGEHHEAEILAQCYRNALRMAKETGCETVAFPLISSGNYGFSKALALKIAIREISDFLLEEEMTVYLTVFGKEAVDLSEKLFLNVESYIDENYVKQKTAAEGGIRDNRRRRLEEYSVAYGGVPNWRTDEMESLPKASSAHAAGAFAKTPGNIEEMLRHRDASFSETLLKLIDRTGEKDPVIYKRANVDRKLFSKIRSNPSYRPSKETALAFAFALHLSLEEAKDLIGRAGYALSHSSKSDIIAEYFLLTQNYDLGEVNQMLFAYDLPLFGG